MCPRVVVVVCLVISCVMSCACQYREDLLGSGFDPQMLSVARASSGVYLRSKALVSAREGKGREGKGREEYLSWVYLLLLLHGTLYHFFFWRHQSSATVACHAITRPLLPALPCTLRPERERIRIQILWG